MTNYQVLTQNIESYMTTKQPETPRQYEPPTHLSERSREIWRAVVPRRAKSLERIALITVALESLDRADEAAAAVRSEGMTSTTKTTGAIHVHPLVKVERESRQLFAKVWGQLHLSWTAEIDGRLDSKSAYDALTGGQA